MTSGAAAVQIISFVFAPVTAHLFAPATLGANAVFVSLVGILAVVFGARYDLAMALPADQRDRVTLFGLCLGLQSIGFFIFCWVVWFLGDEIKLFFGLQQLGLWIWCLPLVTWVVSLSQLVTKWNIREGNFTGVVGAQMGQSLSHNVIQTASGWATHGHIGAMICSGLIGHLTLAGRLAGNSSKALSGLREIQWSSVRRLAKQYIAFPLYNSWAAITDLMVASLPLLFVNTYYGNSEAGYYRMAVILVTVPIAALSASLSSVYWNRSSREASRDVPALARRHRQLTFCLALLGMALVAGSLLLPWLVPALLGERWAPAGRLAVWLAVSAAFGLATSPLDSLTVLGFNRWEAMWVLARMLGLGAVLFMIFHFNLEIETAVASLAAFFAFYYVLLFTLNRLAFRKRLSAATCSNV